MRVHLRAVVYLNVVEIDVSSFISEVRVKEVLNNNLSSPSFFVFSYNLNVSVKFEDFSSNIDSDVVGPVLLGRAEMVVSKLSVKNNLIVVSGISNYLSDDSVIVF